jgi:hypothetical protein
VIAAVFAQQGLGMLFSSFFSIFGLSLDIVWRLLLGFGALPALGALFFRVRMHSDTRQDTSAQERMRSSFVKIKSIWRTLLGCMLAWFLFGRLVLRYWGVQAPSLQRDLRGDGRRDRRDKGCQPGDFRTDNFSNWIGGLHSNCHFY